MADVSPSCPSVSGPRKVAVVTLGCKINQYDSSGLAAGAESAGHTVVKDPAEADVIVVNTCTVTGKTDYKGRQLIRKMIHENPSAVIVVTGCYAQVQPDSLARIPGVDYVLGNSAKPTLTAKISELVKRSRPEVRVGEIRGGCGFDEELPEVHSGNTRAFLKIQDGCNEACAYCIVPRARGRSRSLPWDLVLKKLDTLARKGFQEVVLCGIHLGVYGLDLSPKTSLAALLEKVEAEGLIPRIRLSSIEPNEVEDDLLRLFSSSRCLCPHFHLPMQSGDGAILRAMGRRYTPEGFADRVLTVRKFLPEAAIGVDVIAGFPGEGEAEFRNTVEMLRFLPVSYFHVFPFSRRPGVAASKMAGQVAPSAIHERAAILRGLGQEKRSLFYESFLGRELEILVETSRDRETGMLKGVSRNYVPVLFGGTDCWKRSLVQVKVSCVKGRRVFGEISPLSGQVLGSAAPP